VDAADPPVDAVSAYVVQAAGQHLVPGRREPKLALTERQVAVLDVEQRGRAAVGASPSATAIRIRRCVRDRPSVRDGYSSSRRANASPT
jgi:hypothetical protein